jgi:hypothetical protein
MEINDAMLARRCSLVCVATRAITNARRRLVYLASILISCQLAATDGDLILQALRQHMRVTAHSCLQAPDERYP